MAYNIGNDVYIHTMKETERNASGNWSTVQICYNLEERFVQRVNSNSCPLSQMKCFVNVSVESRQRLEISRRDSLNRTNPSSWLCYYLRLQSTRTLPIVHELATLPSDIRGLVGPNSSLSAQRQSCHGQVDR